MIQAVYFAEWCKAGLQVNWMSTTAASITVLKEERCFSTLFFLFKIFGLHLLLVLILMPNTLQKLSYDPKIKVQKKLLLLNKFGKHHIPYQSRRFIMLINMLKVVKSPTAKAFV